MTVNADEISFWGDERVLELESGDDGTPLNLLKTTKLLNT